MQAIWWQYSQAGESECGGRDFIFLNPLFNISCFNMTLDRLNGLSTFEIKRKLAENIEIEDKINIAPMKARCTPFWKVCLCSYLIWQSITKGVLISPLHFELNCVRKCWFEFWTLLQHRNCIFHFVRCNRLVNSFIIIIICDLIICNNYFLTFILKLYRIGRWRWNDCVLPSAAAELVQTNYNKKWDIQVWIVTEQHLK